MAIPTASAPRPARPPRCLAGFVIAALLAALSPTVALAADPAPLLRLESHGPDQGLPQSSVKALANDDQGFLWVATQDGLARFDGHRFEAWRSGTGARALASGSIDSMRFDPSERRLWLGTNDAGLEVLHLPGWTRIRVDRDRGLSHNKVSALALDGHGGAWVGTGAGLDHIAIADGAGVVHLGGEAEITALVTLPGTGVALALGRDCRVWRATRSRLDLLVALPARGDCIAMQAGPEGAWAASEPGRLFLFDPADGRIRRNSGLADATGLATDIPRVTALLRRADGSLLMGLRDGRVLRLAEASADAPQPLHFDRSLDSPVDVLHEDPAGTLWIGTYTSGLHYVRPLSSAIRVGGVETGNAWPAGSMRAIWRKGPHILLGTDNGLLERRGGDATWHQVAGFEGQSVRAIAASADGWWIGSHDGLHHWSGQGLPTAVPGLPDERIDALLFEGESGWIGTRGGLARLEQGRIVDAPALAPLRRSHVTALLRSGERLWIATNADGLWSLDPGTPPRRAFTGDLHHSLWSLLAHDGALWAGSYAEGIYRIGHERGDVSRTTRRDGLGNDVVYSLLADGLGRLWASTNNGLSVLDPDTGTIQVLGPRDGLANREYNSGAAFRDPDGLLYFGGTRGIDVVDPSRLPRHSPPARPVLTTLQALPLDADGTGPREIDIVYARQARLEHRDRLVTIHMAAIDFSAPDAARLRYRVLGLHKDWVYPRAPSAEFSVTALPSGRYALEVEAAGRDGHFGQARRLELQMAPPWWRHPSAYAAYAVAMLLLLGLVARRVRGAMRRERNQVELLERTVAERTAQLQLANQSLSRTNAQLDIANRRDPLTRISNRRDLQEWLGREAAALRDRMEASASGGGERLVFLMIDIDDFKHVNDAHGHQAGDEVLVRIADRLRLLSREDDLLVRWGGEEFLMVSRFSHPGDAALLAERIRAAISSQPIRVGRGLSLDLTCSIGFAPWPFSMEWPSLGDWSACLELADRCLYKVKRGGKNGWAGLVPGDAPQAEAIQALLTGAEPDTVDAGTVRLLRSPAQPLATTS